MIDRDGPTPIYIQIANILREQIQQGEYGQNERIPSEAELQGTYGVSHLTARKAVKILIDEGLAFRSKGKGTFVT